jgi:hypothetical protein
MAQDICAEQEPELVERGAAGAFDHPSACHFAAERRVIADV